MKRISYSLARVRPHILPVLIWLVAVTGVAMLFHRRSQRFEILGMAQGQVRQVSSTCTGRLKVVPLELFQQVKAGDVVAVIDTLLDDEHLDAELAAASAQVQYLQAELVDTEQRLLAEAANLKTDRIEAQRRFAIDVENARLRVLELKTLLETDRIMLEDIQLSSRIVVTRTLADQNDVPHYERKRMRVEYSALAKKIEENERLLVQAENDLKQARQRRDDFEQHQLQLPPLDTALDVIRRAINVQEKQIGVLLAKTEALVLKSPIDGMVIQVLGRPRDVALRRPGELVVRRAGEVVLAGETILTIAETEPREIIAYANRQQLSRIREGMPVQLIKNVEPAQIARSQVTYIGATLERMPECLWEIPNVPQWGHPIMVPIPQGLKVIPGEMVGIRGL